MLTNTNLFLELCLIHSFDHLPSFEKEKKKKKLWQYFSGTLIIFPSEKKCYFYLNCHHH